MKRILLALLLMAAPALAQVGQDPNERIQKLVPVKYADANSFQNLLLNFGVEVRTDSRMKVVALSGPRSRVMTAEDAIKQLDVPSAAQKDVDLTVYFVVGSDQTNQPGSPIPSDLQSTVATLKSTFPFKNYVMLDVLSLRARSGVGASTTGQLTNGRLTQFSVRSANLDGDGSIVRLDDLHAGLRIPNGVTKNGDTAYLNTGISTDVVDVKEGQKLVVGRSSLNGPDTALFLVLIAKVAQ
ncbi:MAG TPA: secretin N-terminal domain-containing protein [Bryobacteraceae bacterium]|nr:secretin N-terminal domain-containing protein [Bryobacteraceae bacterium]